MKKVILGICLLLSLTSCSNSLKRKLGLVSKSPDAHQIPVSKDLVIPIDFLLPEPKDQTDNAAQMHHTKKKAVGNMSQSERELFNKIGS